VTEPEQAEPKQVPRTSGLRNLAWGLAGMGLAFTLSIGVGACVTYGYESLRAQGLVRPVTPRARPDEMPFGLPRDAVIVALLFAVFSPFVFAGAVAALRVRWWYGPALSLAFGTILTAVIFSPMSDMPLEAYIFMPLWWLLNGMIGGALSALRRRYHA
jgi:hypothetical protein